MSGKDFRVSGFDSVPNRVRQVRAGVAIVRERLAHERSESQVSDLRRGSVPTIDAVLLLAQLVDDLARVVDDLAHGSIGRRVLYSSLLGPLSASTGHMWAR